MFIVNEQMAKILEELFVNYYNSKQCNSNKHKKNKKK